MNLSFEVSAVIEAGKNRPEGYVDDVLSTGRVYEDSGVQKVELTRDQYMALKAKYTKPQEQTPTQPSVGPGSELKKLLSRIGITAKPNCSCNARAKRMDELGVEWCRQNINEISSWLREEATKRKLPYSDMVGKALISLAIRKAEKALADMPQEAASRT